MSFYRVCKPLSGVNTVEARTHTHIQLSTNRVLQIRRVVPTTCTCDVSVDPLQGVNCFTAF